TASPSTGPLASDSDSAPPPSLESAVIRRPLPSPPPSAATISLTTSFASSVMVSTKAPLVAWSRHTRRMSGSEGEVQIVRPSTAVQTLDPETGESKRWDVLPGRRRTTPPDPAHVEVLVEALSGKGAAHFNAWRAEKPDLRPNLATLEFQV